MCSKPRGKSSRLVHHKHNLITDMCEVFAGERRGIVRLARTCSVQLGKSISQPTIQVYATNRFARRHAQQLHQDETTKKSYDSRARRRVPNCSANNNRKVRARDSGRISNNLHRLGWHLARKPIISPNVTRHVSRCHGNPRKRWYRSRTEDT